MRLVRGALLAAGSLLAAACVRPEPCATLPRLQNDPSADAQFVRLHVENRMRDYFEPTVLCVLVDDHVVFQPTPEAFARALAKHRSIDIAMRLRRGVEHQVTVRLRYVGRGPPLDGYRFDIESGHRFAGEGDVFARVVERGGPLTPYEQRPMIEWTDPAPGVARARAAHTSTP